MYALAAHLDEIRTSDPGAWFVRPTDVLGFGAHREVESLLVGTDGRRRGTIINPGVSARIAGLVNRRDRSGGRDAIDLELSVHGPDVAALGLTCGGDLWLRAERAAGLPDPLLGELRVGAPVAYAVHLGNRAGHLVVDACGASTASLGDALLDQRVEAEAVRLLRRGCPARRRLEITGCPVLLDVYLPRPRVLIVGSGPLAEALVAQAALLRWEAWAAVSAGAAVSYAEALAPGDAVLVLSHDPALDTPVLAAALQGDAGYIGALGSWRTQAERCRRLAAAGTPPDRVAALRGPAGLNLGAGEPAETAVSIMAEVLAVRAGGSARPLRDHDGPIHRRR